MKSLVFFTLIACYFFSPSSANVLQNDQWSLSSLDKKINVTISNSKNGLTYAVTCNKIKAIGASPLGILRDDQQFSTDLTFITKSSASIDEAYTLLIGRKLQCRNRANELTLTFENKNKEQVQIIFRAYNDGMAFRYHFPKTDKNTHKIISERSGFALSTDAKAWIQPYDLNSRMKPCYEAFYQNEIVPGTVSPNPAGWAFPALFNTKEGLWILITEAALDESYCATHLEDKNSNGIYTIRFPEKEEVTSAVDPEPVSSLPWTTPWRVAVIGSSLNAIDETSLITDLNPPSVIQDVSWIKPGRSSWSWWSNGSTPRDYNVQKEYIDFNASMGWEFVLIDAGWPQMTDGKMEDLVHYANSKGVGIVLWYHSGMGREKDTLSMANLMAFPESRKKEFEKIQRWGVKGVKVDFFDSDKQPVIKRYFDILRDAADHKITVNFHGSTLPRGWQRTYPHLMSMEAVKGAEGYGRQEFCDRAPVQNTILPYTRNVVGPMDYTPVTFTNKRDAKRQTSFGHELALSIVFESGIFHFADRMSSYQSLPEAPKNFLKEVPVTWDETKLISGFPGKYIVIARRKGDTWYIGGINGESTPRQLSCILPFIKGETELNIITDGETPETFESRRLSIKDKTITVTIQPRGGFVSTIRVKP